MERELSVMEKREVDRIIRDYVKPLYGFALNKTGRIAEAEELASRIVLEVYRSLLRKPDVHDLGRYVFKIAHYTWARYAGEKGKAANCVPLDDHGGAMADPDEGYEGILRQETAGELRREIAFLSRQQRDIVIKYYYGGMTIGEIAGSAARPVPGVCCAGRGAVFRALFRDGGSVARNRRPHAGRGPESVPVVRHSVRRFQAPFS